ncbi:MAG: hypothetical protein IKQ04_06995 [Oscillospiraceae bacterium]|nr:hypothetical protein [Oscillospiraceae bacterium]
MKKTRIFILTALLLLSCLTGCGSEPEPTASASTEATAPQESSIRPTAPAEYANPFSDTPPEGDVIVLNPGFGQDIWPRHSGFPEFDLYVISKHLLDTTDFSLSMPIQSGYTAEVNEISVIPAPNLDMPSDANTAIHGIHTFPYYLYQIYRGTDWKEYASLQQKLESLDIFSDPDDYNATQEARDTLALQYWQDYLSLTARDLPVFYAYQIQVRFSMDTAEIYDEECSRIELHLGDFDTVLEGGSFRIHAESPPLEVPSFDGWLGIHPGILGPFRAYCWAWDQGIERIEQLMDLDATEDITLTDFSIYGGRLEVLALNVTISSDSGGAVDFYWDGKTPVKLKAGEHLDITAVVRDPSWSGSYNYGARSLAIMRYSCGEKTATHLAEIILESAPDLWEAYAAWFDGLDISSYYRDYYRYDWRNDWRAEFTEAQP